ncbi:MAG: ParB/RepB/Spo0J family partition protein [Gammaproteobacteria bacterium]|nr:ParB/RepB/Spo0J family partition protein [Gammaproteobacteria bacterium]
MPKQAFDAKRLSGWWMPPEEIVIIGIDTDDGPEHPLYDDRIKLPLDEDFLANVSEHGVHTPVKIRKNGDQAECVFGRQRVRAAREVNLRRKKRKEPPLLVPCTKEQAEDKRLMAIGFSENSARTNNDPIQEARDMQKLKSQGYDESEVAVHFAVSTQLVRKRLALLELAALVVSAVRAGQLAPTAALALKSLSHDEQKEKLAEIKTTSAASGNGKRPTARAAAAAAGRHVLPNKKQLKKILESGALADASAESFLRYLIGEWPPSKVKGLTTALKEIGLAPKDAS